MLHARNIHENIKHLQYRMRPWFQSLKKDHCLKWSPNNDNSINWNVALREIYFPHLSWCIGYENQELHLTLKFMVIILNKLLNERELFQLSMCSKELARKYHSSTRVYQLVQWSDRIPEKCYDYIKYLSMDLLQTYSPWATKYFQKV